MNRKGMVFLVALCLLTMLLPASSASAVSDRDALPKENVAFFYEQVANFTDAQLATKLKGAKWVVITRQGSEDAPDYWAKEAAAAYRLIALGFLPVHYVQWQHFAANSGTTFGINLTAHPEWRFCYANSTWVSTRTTTSNGVTTTNYFPDMNITAARHEANLYLDQLWAVGFTRLFFDLGDNTYLNPGTPNDGPPISNVLSGCPAGQPLIDPNRTFAYSQWAIMRGAHDSGWSTFLNCCVPSALEGSSVTAAHLANVWADNLLAEQTKLSAAPNFSSIVGINNESQSLGGRVINFQCAETTPDPNEPLYAWGRAKLWNQPVALNTGEPPAGGPTGHCYQGVNQFGLFPELSDARLGTPIDATYTKATCATGSTVDCTYYRRYTAGSVFVNTSPSSTLSSGTVQLGTSGCRYVAKVVLGGPPSPIGVVGGQQQCITATSRNPTPKSGTVLLYQTTPW